ncbi:MAG: dehydrogenase [Prevotella sp.]
MADNYLERHREEYELRKKVWLSKKKNRFPVKRNINKPEDESL